MVRVTTDVVMSVEDLVRLLDPERDYGERSYSQVVNQVRGGDLLIEPGQRLPVLKDARTGHTVKGTGRGHQNGVSPQQAIVAEFRKHAADDFDFAYQSLVRGMKAGDPRYDKIWWEYAAGKVAEFRGGDDTAKAIQVVLDYVRDRPDTRTVEIIPNG